MESPIDYVAGLSLTFEQANLDFAQHFSRGFAQVGDDATAKLLEQIHRDEIAHVAYGLKWFRRWKNPNESDWDAFCRQLKFPLSPQRAKGFSLNIDARRAAGLDADFIAQLNVFSQSKGRTPSVFLFNPFEEGRIALGKAFTPVKHQQQLARDLENLPQFLCRQDDLVIVSRKPSLDFLSGIKQAGFALPEFVESGVMAERLRDRKLGTLRPWAWGPGSLETLSPFMDNVTGERRAPEQRFHEGIARLYGKAWSAELLRDFLANIPGEPWLCTVDEVGLSANSAQAALAAVASIRSRGHHKVVIKESLGLAGHNAIRLWEPDVLPAQRRWIENATRIGRAVVVEPWLERLADFSAQLEMTARGLKLCGFTALQTDLKGQFQANRAAPNFARRIPGPVLASFADSGPLTPRIHECFERLFALLEQRLRTVDYLGPIGIDAFVYRDAAGQARLKPVVEINPRYTMGRLTLELMKQVCPGSSGEFRLINRASLKATGAPDFTTYVDRVRRQFPLVLEGEPVARIREGVVCLNDPATAEVCLGIFQVHRADPIKCEQTATVSMDRTRP